MIEEHDVERLLAAGAAPHPVGMQLEPPRRFLVVDASRLAMLESAREIPLWEAGEILAARTLVLLPFAGAAGATVRELAPGRR